jgi:hypothetical protein
MLTQDEFDLDIVVTHLAGLCPEAVASLPLADLEWILADFVINWGQRLVLDAEAWPAPAEREAARLFGQSWWPLFIAPDFPRVSDEQLRTLTLAATCFHLYIIYQDEAMDNPDSTPPGVQLAIPYVLERFYHLSAMLFAPESRFWDPPAAQPGRVPAHRPRPGSLYPLQHHRPGFSGRQRRQAAHADRGVGCAQHDAPGG